MVLTAGCIYDALIGPFFQLMSGSRSLRFASVRGMAQTGKRAADILSRMIEEVHVLLHAENLQEAGRCRAGA